MTSANYIPLSQVSTTEFYAPPGSPKDPSGPGSSRHSLRSYLSRRRAVIGLVLATSLVTLGIFLRVSLHDDIDDYDLAVNPNYRPSYIAVPVPDALPPSARPKLRPVRELPTECLEDYYQSGLVCHDGKGPVPMDVLWTWTNGSDPVFSQTRERAAASYDEDDPYRPIQSNNPLRMFRDHDELRHSIRSVLANYRPYTNHFHILTSDMDYPAQGSDLAFPHPGSGYWRLGLQPQWLNSSGDPDTEWCDGDVRLSLTHHAHFFEPYNHSIFNSYAIESQFSHLQNVSETFIYMNDDFYMTTQLTPFTFYTHQYGTVLRLRNDLQVSPDWPGENAQGEWRSMGVSNFLLSKRFGKRRRPYVQHQAKSVSFAILQELALFWPDWIAKTGTHAFRETEAGEGDFYQMFVFAHFLVERAREAMLWAWVVGRVGALDDGWGEMEAQRAWVELGGAWDGHGSQEIHVESGVRETLDEDRVRANLEEGGITGPFHSEYLFSSLDGYAYNQYGRRAPTGGWPSYKPVEDVDYGEGEEADKQREEDAKERERRRCTIKRDECFGLKGPDGGPPTASAIFKEIAFNKPECGDCAIIALTNASGKLGLSAFLPSPDRRSPHSDEPAPEPSSAKAIPHLPIVDDWHDGQFALRDVMKHTSDASVREFAMRLMQRYRYVIGQTPAIFEHLITIEQVKHALSSIDEHKDLALLCMNDDIARDDEAIARYFYRWQERRWGTPAAWEADVRRHRRRSLDEPDDDGDDDVVSDSDEESGARGVWEEVLRSADGYEMWDELKELSLMRGGDEDP